MYFCRLILIHFNLYSMKRLVWLVAFLMICGLGFSQESTLVKNRPLPSVDIKDVKGNPFNTSKIENDGKPIIISFWATWCKPCMMVGPIIEELADEYTDKFVFAKVDVGQNSRIGSRYGMSLPNIIVFKDGKPAAQLVGFKPKAELKRMLDGVIA